MNYELVTEKSFSKYYDVFVVVLKTLFPEYTEQTINYFIEQNYNKKWMETEILSGRKIGFVSYEKNDAIGFILFNTVYGGVSTASWIGVLPSHQGRGAATKLLNLWQTWALKHHSHTLQLWTTEKNRKFYEKRGFNYVGMFPSAWFGVDTLLMYKKINDAKEESYLHEYLIRKHDK